MGETDLDVSYAADISVGKGRQKPTNKSSTLMSEMEKAQQSDVIETGLSRNGWAGRAPRRR